MKVLSSLILTLVLFLSTGCQVSNNDFPADEPTLVPSVENSATQPSPMTSNTPDPATRELIQKAQTQLAQKLGIPVESIFVFSVEAVEWPDASLDCPQSGISYAQVVTPGYSINLEAGGQVYTFHTDEKDQVILCTTRGPDEIYLTP